MSYDLPYKGNLRNKTNKQAHRTRGMETRNRLSVTRADGGERDNGEIRGRVYSRNRYK